MNWLWRHFQVATGGVPGSGLASKLHIRGDAQGLPIALHVTAGQEADCSNDAALMEARESEPAIMLADRGYDRDPIRQDLRDRGAVAEIPTTRNRHVRHSVGRPLSALRSRIERFINRLNNSRRVATRQGFVQAALPPFAPCLKARHEHQCTPDLRPGVPRSAHAGSVLHALEQAPHGRRPDPHRQPSATPARIIGAVSGAAHPSPSAVPA
jgi:transposase